MTQHQEPESFDAIIVGAGQAGPSLARDLAQEGKRVVIVEREHVGGTCVNTGCTPSKTMIASARVAHLTRRAGGYGVRADGEAPQGVRVDLRRVQERQREVVASFRDGGRARLEDAENVTLLMGEARFTAARTLAVALPDGERTLTADLVFLTTGERPSIPDLPGLRELRPLDYVSLLELEDTPTHLLILGGGYIAVEYGQMFRRFGADVTIVERGGQLLAREDEDVAQGLQSILEDEGVTVCLNASVREAGRDEQGVWLGLDGGQELRGSHVLVAAGRTPNTEALNLGAAGVETDERGHIKVDDFLRTTAEGVYALGDVKGGPAFTHVAYDDYRVVRDALLHGRSRSIKDRLIPYGVFTDPQLGRIGLSEREAREAGKNVKVAKLPMTSVARAIETGETRGFMKAVVDADSGQILGAAILGTEGAELSTALQIAMLGQLPYTALRDGMFAHPTFAESFNNLFGTLKDGSYGRAMRKRR